MNGASTILAILCSPAQLGHHTFDVDFSTTETALDFSTTAAALSQFASEATQLLRFDRDNALLGLVRRGLPTVHREEIDAKGGLEAGLKQACERFCNSLGPECVASSLSFRA